MTNLNKADLKAELKTKSDKLTSQDKELFATLSKSEITDKKKERAINFRKENHNLINEQKKLGNLETTNTYREMFMEKGNTEVKENNIKSGYIANGLSTYKSVKEPGGISEIITSDENGDIQLIALENRNRIRGGINGGGIRHTHILSLTKGDKQLFIDSAIIRDEFESIKDKPKEWIRKVKILEIKDEEITIGIETSGIFKVKSFNAKTGKLIKNYYIDYAEQEKTIKEKIKPEFDRDSSDLNYSIDNINKVIEKKYDSKIVKKIESGTYIAFGMNEDDKGRVKEVDCYLLKDGRKDFKKIKVDISSINQYRFSGQHPTIRKDFVIKSLNSSDDSIDIDMDFILKEGSYNQMDYHYRNPSELGKRTFNISLKK